MNYYTRSMSSDSAWFSRSGEDALVKRIRDVESKQIQQRAEETQLLLIVTQLAKKCEDLQRQIDAVTRRHPDSGR